MDNDASPQDHQVVKRNERLKKRDGCRRRIIRRSNLNQGPPKLSPELEKAILSLPSNYNFEIPKTLAKIEKIQANHVALQLPEGLLIYSCVLSDLLKRFSKNKNIQISILGDVYVLVFISFLKLMLMLMLFSLERMAHVALMI